MATDPRHVKDLFVAALELPDPQARRELIDRECADDPDLRRRLAVLLDAHEHPESALERPLAPHSSSTVDHPVPLEVVGTMIAGRYKLLEAIGEGGMGEVWVADQLAPIRRRVALKVIKPGMDSRSVLARFEAERQALALMDHSNIARVLDAGTTDDGRPFFVMELVKGTPITTFCDLRKLTPRERLELFVAVCQAIQHAHQKGIIHRDIKPGNVLVALHDEKPVPKVIDFGVAKAVGQQLTEKTLYTGFGALVGTPAYMAPEQATFNQLDVDTRADVYALGVLLYELLAGSPPFEPGRLKKAALDEMLRLVREEEPPRPSTRLSTSEARATIAAVRQTDPAKLAQLVRGELDWIVMKALEKDRNRRYETPTGLARDVERYLKNETVEACPPTVGYRLRKFARKHRTSLVTSAVIAFLLVYGTLAASWLAYRATRAENAALTALAAEEDARSAEAEQHAAAVENELKAQCERDAAEAARQELRRAHYVANMNLAQSAWEASNVGRVQELLNELRPRPNEDDLRDFEWHYWDRQCHAGHRTVALGGPLTVQSLTLSGDGRRLAGLTAPAEGGGGATQVLKVWDTADGRQVRAWSLNESGLNIPRGTRIAHLVLSHDGSRLACSSTWSAFERPAASRASPLPLPTRVLDVSSGQVLFSWDEPYDSLRALSPDGKRMAALGQASGVHVLVWDLTDPSQKPTTLEGLPVNAGEGATSDLRFSPDGACLAGAVAVTTRTPTAGPEGVIRTHEVRIWDAATGRVRATLPTPPVPPGLRSNGWRVEGLAFSPDGQALVALASVSQGTGSTAYSTWRWEGVAGNEPRLARSTPLTNFGVHGFGLTGDLVFSGDGRYLAAWAVSSQQPVVQLVDAATGEERGMLKGHVGPVRSVAVSADGHQVISAGDSADRPTVRIWDVPVDAGAAPEAPDRPPPERDALVEGGAGGRRARYYPPGSTAARNEVSIRDGAGKELFVFREHTAPVSLVTFSPDGRLVLSQAGIDTRREPVDIKVWEIESGKVRWSGQRARGDAPGAGLATRVDHPRFSPDGRFLVVHDAGGVRVLRTDDFQDACHLGPATGVVIGPNSRRLVASYAGVRDPGAPVAILWLPGGEAKLWSTENGQEIARYGALSPVTFSRDGQLFAAQRWSVSAGALKTSVAVWDAATGEERTSFGEVFPVNRIVFSPDSTRLLTVPTPGAFGTASGSVTVWDATTGRPLFRLEGPLESNVLVAFSPDGRRIATCLGTGRGQPSEVKLWDAATGRGLLGTKATLPGGSFDIFFSPDGQRLFFGPTSRPRLIWDAAPRSEAKSP
jgi:WD40 repeat protein/tRNA A-37 threonylcarbamoyl transferase component Bud32